MVIWHWLQIAEKNYMVIFIEANIKFLARAITTTNVDPTQLGDLSLLISLEKPMDDRILKNQQTVSQYNIHVQMYYLEI